MQWTPSDGEDSDEAVRAAGPVADGEDSTEDRLPRYRVLTGPDDAAFCRRVSAALELGYRLHEGPAVTSSGGRTIVAQAVIWDRPDPTPSVTP